MRLLVVAAALALALPHGIARAQNAANSNPAVGTGYKGCVEGRSLRIVNGLPSCAQTAAPTLTNCGAGTIDVNATDFIGQVTIPAGLTSCTIVMSKLYSSTFVCGLFPQKAGITLTLGSQTIGSNGASTTLQVPFGLTLTSTAFGYICGPG